MGLFSYVKLELPCPFCGYLIKDFQSKDGILMQENDPWTLNNFYTKCDGCSKWVEYVRKGSELSSIDLIEQAVNILRQIRSSPFYWDFRWEEIELGKEIEKFLESCHYPRDNNWLDWYILLGE
jgi:hypothetical protein